MKGIRFYLEHPSPAAKRKGQHAGTVLAVDVDEHGCPRWFFSAGEVIDSMVECMGAIYAQPNSPVCSTSVGREYLTRQCKRIAEAQAREIHPALFERLELGNS